MSMASKPVECPRLNSLDELATIVGTSMEDIQHAAINAESYYAPFAKKPKTKPFSRLPDHTRARVIEPPTGFLMHLLAKIHSEILQPIQLPDYLVGGVRGKSVLDNLQNHSRSKVLVRLDIKSYFPSVSDVQIQRVWNEHFGCPNDLARLLTRLTTYRGHLPQGAPTSTRLAYLFLHSIDGQVRRLCAALGVDYTVWVDDMAFSGDRARDVIGTAI